MSLVNEQATNGRSDMFTAQKMKHFITTPFCVRRPFKGQGKSQLPSQEWLDHRLKLFKDYCLPSVTGQSDQNFDWFIYFDEAIPVDYLNLVRSLTAQYKNISVKLCSVWEPAVISNDIGLSIAETTKWVITTRLDNDDGLHRDFVAKLHAVAQEREEFLNFPCGIILYSEKCYRYTHLSNAFLSLVEPAGAPRTVWSTAHEQAASVAPIRQLADAPAFLQVVHGQNVSNKPRGTRVYAADALLGFDAISLHDLRGKSESWIDVMSENATTVAFWKFRDFLIYLAKKLLRK